MTKNFKITESVSVSKIKKFVYLAKMETFAASDKKASLVNQDSVFSYRKFDSMEFGGLIYNDQYNGNTVESGQETVSLDLRNIWRNQYYGGSYISYWDGKEVKKIGINSEQEIKYLPFITIEFLKTALRQLPEEFPVRGPKYFKSHCVSFEDNLYYGEWEYINTWSAIPMYKIMDSSASFQGKEIIKCNGVELYWHGYHGGFLRDKYYPIALKE